MSAPPKASEIRTFFRKCIDNMTVREKAANRAENERLDKEAVEQFQRMAITKAIVRLRTVFGGVEVVLFHDGGFAFMRKLSEPEKRKAFRAGYSPTKAIIAALANLDGRPIFTACSASMIGKRECREVERLERAFLRVQNGEPAPAVRHLPEAPPGQSPAEQPPNLWEDISGPKQRELVKCLQGKGAVVIPSVLLAVYQSKSEDNLEALAKLVTRTNQTLTAKSKQHEISRQGNTFQLRKI